MSKTAIILFNLGGPDRPEAVRPFLFNLFNDPAILRLPKLPRWFLANLISTRRTPTAREIYNKIGGGSPILVNTQKQAKSLENKLSKNTVMPAQAGIPFGSKEEYKCFIAMRYWHPMTDETVAAVKSFAPDQIILVPLYPQFSTTTTHSSLKTWRTTAAKAGLSVPTKTICCYPQQPGFITALAARIKKSYAEAAQHGTPRILFSAHGLPEKIVQAGDPYPEQCERTVAALHQQLNIENLDSILCYQSRVGPLRWITPATDDEIKRAGNEKRPLVVAPVAFVSEHSETLVEIDMEYRHLAQQSGVPFYAYTGTVAEDPAFIDGLAALIREAMHTNHPCLSGNSERICGAAIATCPMKESHAL